jgi:CO dehydrogenase maturation factor
MKIAVAGKGGVGKTFISATLSRLLARDGYTVLAVDADPDQNLAYSLGLEPEIADNIVPLSENEKLIEERTGSSPEKALGVVFNMNPRVNDIVDKFGIVAPDNVKLLVMGKVKGGGKGCMCGSNALLRVLIQHMLIQRGEILIMDMVAGLEHLGRGTARRMNAMLIVVEPRMKAVDTAKRIKGLAKEIEIEELLAVGNKVTGDRDREFIELKMSELGIPVVAHVPYDEKVIEADMMGKPTLDHSPGSEAIKAVDVLKRYLIDRYKP